MQLTSKKMVAAGLALLVSATACDNSKITRVNINPNAPTTAPSGALFTQAASNVVGRFLGRGVTDLRGTEWISQQLAEVQYPQEDQYSRLQGSNTAGTFNAPYTAELENQRRWPRPDRQPASRASGRRPRCCKRGPTVI